jgi:hypothetical protein
MLKCVDALSGKPESVRLGFEDFYHAGGLILIWECSIKSKHYMYIVYSLSLFFVPNNNDKNDKLLTFIPFQFGSH